MTISTDSNKPEKVSILIAAYNEERTIRPCVEGVLKAPLPENVGMEIVVVNDASRDSTGAILDQMGREFPQIKVIHKKINEGKGAGIRTAIEHMTGRWAIWQDADLEYDPSDYRRLLRPLRDGRADVVYGSRFRGEECRVLYFWHMMGNKMLTIFSNMVNNLTLSDMETCYKAFDAKILKSIPIECNRFGIEPEITAKVARRGLRIYEVPISYNGRTYAGGKKIGWKDGVAALWFIFKFRWMGQYQYEGETSLDAHHKASLERNV